MLCDLIMLEEKQVQEFLRGIEAFSGVSLETLDKLALAFHERACHPGEVVICQGARSSELCVVVEGELVVTIAEKAGDEDGGETVRETVREVATLKPGTLFGEIGVISGMEASASVSASMEGCRILALGERELHEQVLRNSPKLAAGLLRSMKRYL